MHDVKLLDRDAVHKSFDYFRKVCSKWCSKVPLELLIAAVEVELLLPTGSWLFFNKKVD